VSLRFFGVHLFDLGVCCGLGQESSYILTTGCSLAKDNFSSSPLHPLQLPKYMFLHVISYSRKSRHSASCRQTEDYQSVTRNCYFGIFLVPELQECNTENPFICAQVTSPRIPFCKSIPNHLLHVEEDMSKEFAAKNVSVISTGMYERDQSRVHLFF